MREAFFFENREGPCDIVVFDQHTENPVWSKTFDTYNTALAFLLKAGWRKNSLGCADANNPSTWRYGDEYSTELSRPFQWRAVEAKPSFGPMLWVQEYYGVHSLELDDELITISANAVVISCGFGFAFWYGRDWETPFIERRGNFDPVLSLVTPAPVVIEAIGTWSHEKMALDRGVDYFNQLKKLYGELFDEALRANILRNDTRNIIGGDGGVDSGGDA